MKKKFILFLVSPRQKFCNYPAQTELAKIFGKRRFMIPLALPTLAALTPDAFEIHIYDEEIESLPEHIKPDLVGITTLAATAKRAFFLGDKFREIGAKVVFGGAYASYMTDEALLHGDSVIVGEAENSWPVFLKDFENGQIRRIYRPDGMVPYLSQPPPRWDLVNMKRIFQVGIQVSRGCPFNCDFCLVSKTFGREMRYRSIGNVVDEIRSAPTKYFFFVDDNLTFNKNYVKELMKALIPLRISWGCMCSIDVAKDEELLKLMAEAGCFNILIGFESLSPASLTEANKGHNQGGKNYAEAIRRINGAGIHINASFVVGFDSDTLASFDRIFDFTMEHHLPFVNLHLLSAPPGTAIFDKLSGEGRLSGYNSDLGGGHIPNMHYKNMSQEAIFEKYMETVERLFFFRTIREKALALFEGGNFTRPGGEIPFLLKMRLVVITFQAFLFTSDPDRRKLLFTMIHLVRSKKVAVDKGFGFLISILGFNRHILEHRRNHNQYMDLIRSRNKDYRKEPGVHTDLKSHIA
ncbi:MAG: radical SAM protein [bacterium]